MTETHQAAGALRWTPLQDLIALPSLLAGGGFAAPPKNPTPGPALSLSGLRNQPLGLALPPIYLQQHLVKPVHRIPTDRWLGMTKECKAAVEASVGSLHVPNVCGTACKPLSRATMHVQCHSESPLNYWFYVLRGQSQFILCLYGGRRVG